MHPKSKFYGINFLTLIPYFAQAVRIITLSCDILIKLCLCLVTCTTSIYGHPQCVKRASKTGHGHMKQFHITMASRFMILGETLNCVKCNCGRAPSQAAFS